MTEDIFKTADIVFTEEEHICLMATNRRAYIKSFSIVTKQLDDFVEQLDCIINFHRDNLYTGLKEAQTNSRQIFDVLRCNFTDQILNEYRKYALEAGRAIHKFQTCSVSFIIQSALFIKVVTFISFTDNSTQTCYNDI